MTYDWKPSQCSLCDRPRACGQVWRLWYGRVVSPLPAQFGQGAKA